MISSKPTRIAELSASIQSNVQIIDSYFESTGLPSLSFDLDYPSNLPLHITDARDRVLEATDELSDLMLGPQQLVECHPPQVSFNLIYYGDFLTFHLAYLADWDTSHRTMGYRELPRRRRGSDIQRARRTMR